MTIWKNPRTCAIRGRDRFFITSFDVSSVVVGETFFESIDFVAFPIASKQCFTAFYLLKLLVSNTLLGLRQDLITNFSLI